MYVDNVFGMETFAFSSLGSEKGQGRGLWELGN